MPLQDRIHKASDWLFASLFPHSDWWLHVVVHIVLVATPLAFLGIALVCFAGAVRQRLARAQANKPSGFRSPFPTSLFAYILKHTGRRQGVLLILALASMPMLYAVLELPKQVINRALEDGAQDTIILGEVLSKYDLLLILCLLYLAAVLTSGAIKYRLNVLKGRLAESMLRRIRLTAFRVWSREGYTRENSELIPVLVQEVEPVAGFTGESLLTPVFEGGTFLTILLFMMIQDPVLGAAALTLLPVQIAVIPRLQRHISKLNRERAKELRSFSALLAEADPRSRPGRVHSVTRVASSIKRIQDIRFEIYCRKFFMKGLNNFIAHLTPFFFYTIGGYLVIDGRLSLGALVAVLAAYKDMSNPLRELLTYYQFLADVRVRYEDIRCFLADPASTGTTGDILRIRSRSTGASTGDSSADAAQSEERAA